MKRFLFAGLLATVVVAGAFVEKANGKLTNPKNSTSLALQAVYYGSPSSCPSTATCSNIPGPNCIAGITTYYDVQATCSPVSAFKYRQ